MFDTVKIGRKIAECRKQKNMTQVELADAMGVSFQAVSNWERGNSMPDISKLSELAEILGISIDELLGKKNPVVEKLAKEEKVNPAEVSREDMLEAAEIAKPLMVEEMVEEGDIEDVAAFLPFLSDRAVAKLAHRYYAAGKDIAPLLPFLDEKDVDELMLQAAADGKATGKFLPFASEEALAKVARRDYAAGKDIASFLPFLDDADVKALAMEALDKGGIGAIKRFLPFLDEEDTDALAEKFLRKRGAGTEADE